MLVLLLFFGVATAFPNGVPSIACSTMTPGHGFQAQSHADLPFSLNVSPTSVVAPKQKKDETNKHKKSSEHHVVTLTISSEEKPFKGFFVQAQGNNTSGSIGTFLIVEGPGRYVDCQNGLRTGVTHANNEPKSKVILKWIAPFGFQGEVKFKTTIVQDFQHYWVDLESSPISVTQ